MPAPFIRTVLSVVFSISLLTCVLCSFCASAQNPVYNWAGGLIPSNSGSSCYPQKTVVDGSGNVYTIGWFQGTIDFDPSPGTANLISSGSNTTSDIFVSKLDASGTYIWAKRMGGTNDENGYGLAVDGSGNVYTTGYFYGTADFDPGPGTANLTSSNVQDIFISKLDSSGSYVWAKKMGGNNQDVGNAIAVDGNGNVYTTGYFSGTADFDPGPGTVNFFSSTNAQIFISKLDASGTYVWAKHMGGTGGGRALGLDVDANGNVYTTGEVSGTLDFDPGTGTANLVGSDYDIFVSKLDSNGAYVWAKKMGGSGADIASAIVVDDSGNVYSTGFFGDVADFDPGLGTVNLTSAGGLDIFVSKLNASGDYVWARSMRGGGQNTDGGRGIAVDGGRNVYVTGYFYNTVDFDPGSATANLTSAGDLDVFVSKLDAGGTYMWAKRLGNAGGDVGQGIAVDGADNVYATGYFTGTVDFDPGSGTANLSCINNGGFVTKWSQSALSIGGVTSGAMAVYPNPTAGLVTFSSPSIIHRIQITDMAGRAVYTRQPGATNTDVDLRGHAPGVYFYEVDCGETKQRGKLVIY